MLEISIEGHLDFFEAISDYEQVLFFSEPDVGLKGMIVIHDTSLGPALGGTRMVPYPSVEAALDDALRLARGMTYKAAAADLDVGGGKAVLIGDPTRDKSPDLFRAFGRQVHALGGRFYTGTDMGTTPEDFVHAYHETPYLVGLPEVYGGSGDSSVPTALGVFDAIRSTISYFWGDDRLEGRTFVVQGLGKVGMKVARRLLEAGGRLFVAEPSIERIQELRAFAQAKGGFLETVAPDDVYDVEGDVFVPCAFGGVITERTVERLAVKAIVGSANNQLEHPRLAERLAQRGILYAPDYLANAGGLIQVADELYGPNPERVREKVRRIAVTLVDIYRRAEREGLSTEAAAEQIVLERLARRRKLNAMFGSRRPPKWAFRR